MGKIIVPIRGMHCKSCEILIEDRIKNIAGVKHVEVSYSKGKALVTYGAHMMTIGARKSSR
jgi:copper chaperone CopZ